MTDGGIDADQVDDLASAADRLYGLDAEAFVAARDQLVKAVRAGGRRDLATEVKALRRPTVIAAELNRVLRTSPADREALIAAARALAEGQHRLLAGDVVDLAGLQAAHRAAVATLADRAERHRGEIHAALEAASVDESLHPQLHRATFAQEPTPTRGFDLLAAAGLALPAQRPERPPRPTGPAPGSRRLPGSRRPAEPTSPPPGPDAPATPGADAQEDSDGAEPAEGRPAGPRKLQAVPTAKDLELAERRLAAARASEDKAAERVSEAEARLAEARRHHDETIRRRQAAEAARERLADH